jgi:hypothetical protein
MKPSLQVLSKDELLALIVGQGLSFRIKPRHIISAKIAVQNVKQDTLFRQWDRYQLPAHGETIEQHIKYYEERKKREGIWKKYERVWRKIESLYKELEAERD